MQRSKIFLLFFFFLLFFSFLFPITVETFMVPMYDGVELATDVYLPFNWGSYPVILLRTPYGKDKESSFGYLAAANGYAVVIQDVRGRYESQGENHPFEYAYLDGHATVEWIYAQGWCNGKIGTAGMSALGINEYLMAPNLPDYVKCQYAIVATSNLYKYGATENGVMRHSLVYDWTDSVDAEDWRNDALLHPDYDDYWKKFAIDDDVEDINLPAFHIGGWYDIFSQGTINAFKQYQENGGDGAKGKQKLIMGPWTHGGKYVVKQGELTYPTNSLLSNVEHPFQWFKYYLKDVGSVDNIPTVQYYVMGACGEDDAPGNEWRETDSWPVPAYDAKLYLTTDNKLLWHTEDDNDSLTFTSDPRNPTPTIGGANLEIANGPMDQRSLDSRTDLLQFETDPFPVPIEITGELQFSCYLSITTLDADICVRVCDVYPDGREMLILDGALDLRFRNGVDHEELLTPGDIYHVTFSLWSTSIIINRGHKLKIFVSGNNYPRFEVNPQDGSTLYSGNSTPMDSDITIYMGPDYPSSLLIPVPYGSTYFPADLNGDEKVDYKDLGILLSNFDKDYPPYDLNVDGEINDKDLQYLVGNFK